MAIAGVKISSLRELTNAEDNDYIVINDFSTTTTKKISRENFLRNSTNVRDSGENGAFIQTFTCNSLDVNVDAAINGSTTIGADLSVNGTITFDNLKDAVENIIITKFVDEADGISSNDDDVSIPTSAAVKDYVDGAVSDHRAKIVHGETQNGLSLVNQLKVYQTEYVKEVGAFEEGIFDSLIAHEVQEIVPYVVLGEKDAVHRDGKPNYQKINYQKLVPILITAIQELSRQIEELRS